MKTIFSIIACITINAYGKEELVKKNKLTTFDFSDQGYLTAIEEHDCYDKNNQTHLSNDCQLLLGDINKCNGGKIVFTGANYSICKKYVKKNERKNALQNKVIHGHIPLESQPRDMFSWSLNWVWRGGACGLVGPRSRHRACLKLYSPTT